MLVKLDSKRRLTIPIKLAPAWPGDLFEVYYDEDQDTIIATRVKRNGKWLDMRHRGQASKLEAHTKKKSAKKKR